MAKPVAIALYQASPQFSTQYADVKDPTLLPNGSGYKLCPFLVNCGELLRAYYTNL